MDVEKRNQQQKQTTQPSIHADHEVKDDKTLDLKKEALPQEVCIAELQNESTTILVSSSLEDGEIIDRR